MITSAPPGPKSTARRSRSLMHLVRRNWAKPLTITVRYCGYNEPWIEVKSRGVTHRYEGSTCILQVVADFNGRRPTTHR